jgi:hypothetical protein
MAVGLVFFYLAILLYGALLLPVAGFAIYASYRFQRRTAHALWGLLAWLIAAPAVTTMLFVAQDALGLAPDPMHDDDLQSLRISVLGGCLGSLPLFLVPLGIRLFGAREKPPLPA